MYILRGLFPSVHLYAVTRHDFNFAILSHCHHAVFPIREKFMILDSLVPLGIMGGVYDVQYWVGSHSISLDIRRSILACPSDLP